MEWLAGKRRICWFLAGSLLEIHAQGLSHVDSFDPAGGRWHFGWFLAPAYHCPTHWYGNRHGGNGMEWSSNPYISSVMFCVYTPISAIICKQSQQGQWDCPLRQRSLYNWQVEYSGMHRYTGFYVVIVILAAIGTCSFCAQCCFFRGRRYPNLSSHRISSYILNMTVAFVATLTSCKCMFKLPEAFESLTWIHF